MLREIRLANVVVHRVVRLPVGPAARWKEAWKEVADLAAYVGHLAVAKGTFQEATGRRERPPRPWEDDSSVVWRFCYADRGLGWHLGRWMWVTDRERSNIAWERGGLELRAGRGQPVEQGSSAAGVLRESTTPFVMLGFNTAVSKVGAPIG